MHKIIYQNPSSRRLQSRELPNEDSVKKKRNRITSKLVIDCESEVHNQKIGIHNT